MILPTLMFAALFGGGPPVHAPIPIAWESEQAVEPSQIQLAGLTVHVAGARKGQAEERNRVVLMLHGYGRPKDSLLRLAGNLSRRFGTVFLFPEAPYHLKKGGRRAWWKPHKIAGEVDTRLRAEWHNLVGRTMARQWIIALLAEVREQLGVSAQEIVLVGYSQGATLAVDVALNSPEPLGGLALLSGRFISQRDWYPHLTRLNSVPVFMAHGRNDQMAPFGASTALLMRLREAGVLVDWTPYDGGHSQGAGARARFARFLTHVIVPPSIGGGSPILTRRVAAQPIPR